MFPFLQQIFPFLPQIFPFLHQKSFHFTKNISTFTTNLTILTTDLSIIMTNVWIATFVHIWTQPSHWCSYLLVVTPCEILTRDIAHRKTSQLASVQTETSYEQGYRGRAKPNVKCDPLEFCVGTGRWFGFRKCYSGVMPMFVWFRAPIKGLGFLYFVSWTDEARSKPGETSSNKNFNWWAEMFLADCS